MLAPRKYPEEMRDRAVRLVQDLLADPEIEVSVTGACSRVGQQLGINRDTLRGWGKQAQVDAGTNPSPSARLRSLLYTDGGDDFYGIIRTDVLIRIGPHGSYFNADRVFVAGLSLYGPFYQVPEVLYFRREHPNRLSRATTRDRAAGLDPVRRNRLRHPEVRLYGEYVAGYFRDDPQGASERRRPVALQPRGHPLGRQRRRTHRPHPPAAQPVE